MRSQLLSLRGLMLLVALLIGVGVTIYATQWEYIGSAAHPVRVNRWSSRTEYLTDHGWTAIDNDPFRDIGDRRP